MDPVTAALQLVGKIVDAWTAIYQAASPETKTKIADQYFADLSEWRAFLKSLTTKTT